MKFRMWLAAPVLAVLVAASPPVSAAARHTTFQDVTFSFVSSPDYLTLTFSGLTSASGDWTGIKYLAAFQIGIDGLTDATLAGWQDYPKELNASGCGGGTSTNHVCFEPLSGGPVMLTDTMTFNIDLQGPTTDPDPVHLKVAFLDQAAYDKYFCPTCGGYASNWKKTGSLFSAPIPEPEIYAMMGIGIGVMGWVARRRKRAQAAV